MEQHLHHEEPPDQQSGFDDLKERASDETTKVVQPAAQAQEQEFRTLRQVQIRQQRRLYLMLKLGPYLPFSGLFLCLLVLKLGLVPHDYEAVCFCMGFVSIFLLAYLISPVRKRWHSTVQNLASCEDPQVIGSLIDTLGMSDPSRKSRFRDRFLDETQAMARAALVRLLPRLQAGDADLLNKEQRNTLHQILACELPYVWREDAALNVAILKAFAQIGDQRELTLVEGIVVGRGKPHHILVREAAQACLPQLKQRIQQQAQASQLLRPAEDNETQADTLLRPTQEKKDTRRQELLHPIAEDADEEPG
jgi:hypothetical protein